MKDKWVELFPDATTNIVEYLIDGLNYFESIVNTIETAKTSEHYIYILGWMLDVDFPLKGNPDPLYPKKGHNFLKGDKTLFKLLESATGKGVEVRILIWNNPFYLEKNKQSIEKLNKLQNTKVFIDDYTYSTEDTKKTIGRIEGPVRDLIKKYYPFFDNPAARIKEQYDIAPSEVRDQILYYLVKKNVGAHHEKIVIVKGEAGLISFCGGLDINQNRFASYHDSACKVQGPEAHQILNKFIKRWNNHNEAKTHPLKGNNDSKPIPLGPITGALRHARAVGTFNSPDGKDRDRSLKEAYLKIISKARNYIYIEDQYLVNLDVAKELNKKIKEYFFKKLIIVIQDSKETTDIMIPDRKRGEFYDAVTQNTTQEEKQRFSLFMINEDLAGTGHFHPGLHSKTLIVDDEIAIIGSANVNQRSFTLDSETSLIVFNTTDNYYRDNFAFKFRNSIWNEFVLKKSSFSTITWEEFSRNVTSDDRYSILRTYVNSIEDLDKRIADSIKPLSVPLSIGIGYVLESNLKDAVKAISIVNSPVAIREIIDIIWENIIDPEVK